MATPLLKNPLKNPLATSSKSVLAGSSEDELGKLLKTIASQSARVTAAGGKLPSGMSKPNFIERVLGPLQTPLAGVNAIVHNVVNKPSDVDVDILDEMKKAFGGQHYTSGSDIIGDLGWNPAENDTLGKLAKAVAGFGWDVLADPVTYISLGADKLVKLRSLAEAGRIATDGLDVANATRYGLEHLAPAIGEAGGLVKVGLLEKADKVALWKGIVTDTMATIGDKGGLKFMGKSVIPQAALDAVTPQKVKDVIELAQASKPALAIGGAFDPFYKVTHAVDPFEGAALNELTRTMQSAQSKGANAALEEATKLLDQLPKGTRDASTAAFDAAAEPFREQVGSALDALDTANKEVSRVMDLRRKALKDLLRESGVRVDLVDGLPDFEKSIDDALARLGDLATTQESIAEQLKKAQTEIRASERWALRKGTKREVKTQPFKGRPTPLTPEAAPPVQTAMQTAGASAAETASRTPIVMTAGGKPKRYGSWQTAFEDELRRVSSATMQANDNNPYAARQMFETTGDLPRAIEIAERDPEAVMETLAGRVRSALDAGDLDTARAYQANLDDFAEWYTKPREAFNLDADPFSGEGVEMITRQLPGNKPDVFAEIAGGKLRTDNAKFIKPTVRKVAPPDPRRVGEIAREIQGFATKYGRGQAKVRKLSGAVARYIDYDRTLPRALNVADEARAVVDDVANRLDWDAFDKALVQMVPNLSTAEVAQARTAMQTIFKGKMAELMQEELAAGIRHGSRGAGYIPMYGGKAAPEVLKYEGLTGEAAKLPEAAGPGAGTFGRPFGGKPAFAKERTYDSLAERLFEDRNTLTDAPTILAQRMDASTRAVAKKDFERTLATGLGLELPTEENALKAFKSAHRELDFANLIEVDGVKYALKKDTARTVAQLVEPLINDDAMRGLLGYFNKFTSEWRKWATVMNPGFPIRNTFSNFYLAHTKGYSNPEAWLWAGKVRTWMQTGEIDKHLDDIVPGVGKTLGAFLEDARNSGALRGGQAFEIMRDQGMRGALGNPLAKFGTNVNEFAEEWGRLAVFKQAYTEAASRGLRKNATSIAGRMVDKVLYNYDPAALTAFGQYARMFFPFATWKLRNVPEMFSVLAHTPSKISEIGKLQNNGESAAGVKLDKDLLPQYQRDMIPILTPFKDKSGNPLMLNPNFGFQDLNSVDEPFRDFISTLNPLFKLPIEFGMDRDVFFGQDIEEYPGQLKPMPGYAQWLQRSFADQDWWKAVRKSAGMGINKKGQLVGSPKAIKLLDSWPFMANLGKSLEQNSPTRGYKALSWLGGIKLMPYDKAKLTKNYGYEQRAQLTDEIRRLKDAGMIKSADN